MYIGMTTCYFLMNFKCDRTYGTTDERVLAYYNDINNEN